MGFARTRKEARQIVDHKHVLVNGKCVNIPSYLVKAGDSIEIKEKCKGSERYKGILEVTGGRLVPNPSGLTRRILGRCKRASYKRRN